MPCVKKDNGKWGIGTGKGIYDTKEDCEKAQRGYYAQKGKESGNSGEKVIYPFKKEK